MIRKASIMKVHAGCHEEYYRRHQELWPEMKEMLLAHGVISYSIFLDELTNTLFAYLELEDETLWAQATHTTVCQKWWEYMKDIMETYPDNRPISHDLNEVFFLREEGVLRCFESMWTGKRL